jgi:hypothetical protein
MEDMYPENLTGRWHGLYTYPGGLEAAGFVADIVDIAGGLSGTIEEESNGDDEPVRRLTASIDGRRAQVSVRFAKTYLTGGWNHVVFYGGLLSGDRAEIEGDWDIPGMWAGRFLMIRSSALPTAERRRAFEKA